MCLDLGKLAKRTILVAVVSAVEDVFRMVVVHLAIEGSGCLCCHDSLLFNDLKFPGRLVEFSIIIHSFAPAGFAWLRAAVADANRSIDKVERVFDDRGVGMAYGDEAVAGVSCRLWSADPGPA